MKGKKIGIIAAIVFILVISLFVAVFSSKDKEIIDNSNTEIESTKTLNFDVRSDEVLRLRVQNKKYGAVNESGEIVIDFKYDKLWLSSNPFVMAQNGEYSGILDTEGKEIIPFKYDVVYPRGGYDNDYYFYVENDERCGVLNYKNELLIPIEYDNVEFVYNLEEELVYVIAEKLGKESLINLKEKAFKQEYNQINHLMNFENALYFWAQSGEKSGVIDSKGNIIVPFEYKYIECATLDYDEIPFFVVSVSDRKEGLFDIQGKEVLPCEYEYITGEGKYNDKTYFNIVINGNWGIADNNGEIVVACEHDNVVRYIGNGLFEISSGEYNPIKEQSTKYGIVKENGTEIYSCVYTDLVVQTGNNVTLIKIEKEDKKNFVIYYKGRILYSSNNCDNITLYIDSLIPGFNSFKENDKEYIVTENGEIYEAVSKGLNGPMAGVIIKKNNKYGIINHENKFIDIEYDKIKEIEDLNMNWLGGYYVEKDNKFGLVNTNLDFVVPCEIDVNNVVDENYGYMFLDDKCIVKSGDSYGVINKDLEMVVPYEYEKIEIFPYVIDEFEPCFVNEEYLKVKLNNKYGLVDMKNNKILECEYDDITNLEDNLFSLLKDNVYSYVKIENNNVEFVKENCDFEIYVEEFNTQKDRFYIVKQKEKYGLLDKNLKELLPCEYDYMRGAYGDSNWNNECIRFEKDGMQGMYSLSLNMQIVPAEYDEVHIGMSETNTFVVEKDGKFGIYDEKGVVSECVYNNINEVYQLLTR